MRYSESSDNLGQENTIGEKETMKDNLDQDDNNEEDNSPTSFRIIMLKNACYSSFSIN